jgi:hypothetical protein
LLSQRILQAFKTVDIPTMNFVPDNKQRRQKHQNPNIINYVASRNGPVSHNNDNRCGVTQPLPSSVNADTKKNLPGN